MGLQKNFSVQTIYRSSIAIRLKNISVQWEIWIQEKFGLLKLFGQSSCCSTKYFSSIKLSWSNNNFCWKILLGRKITLDKKFLRAKEQFRGVLNFYLLIRTNNFNFKWLFDFHLNLAIKLTSIFLYNWVSLSCLNL